jgi:hypothetical protein
MLLVAVMERSANAKTAPNSAVLRRYALVIGSNTGGGAKREKLKYAGQDATKVADVLRQLGGVDGSDLQLLSEPDIASLDRSIDVLSSRIREQRRSGQRVELVVYYSGHADETGILLAGSRYEYGKLRQRIRAMPAISKNPGDTNSVMPVMEAAVSLAIAMFVFRTTPGKPRYAG